MKRRNGKNLAIGILCCMLVFMGIGYAALSQVLKVTTTGNITGQWKIYIDSADLNTETNTNKIIDATKATSSISSDKLTATTNVSFNEPGEYALYDIVVKNEGNIDAELKNINLTTEANLDNFDVETIGLGTGTKNLKNNPTFSGVNLLANNELSFQLKITFDKDKNLTELPSPDTEYKFTISMNYVQKTSNTSGGGGGTTDDPNAPDFTVDDTGKIVAYNSSKITENDGYVVIPAANSEGKAITSIDKSSFAKSNITIFYTDYEEGAIIDAATEEEYLEIKAKVEELMNEDGSGSDAGSGSSSMAVKNLKPEIKRLNNLINPDIVKVSGSGSGSESGSMTIYWSKEKTVPEDAEIEKYYFNQETQEMEAAISKIEKLDLTQATNLKTIGSYAFFESPLTEIKFGNSIEIIEEGAFDSTELTSVELPNSLKIIGPNAFGSTSITEIRIPDSVTKIGSDAFYGAKITNLELGKGLEVINSYAFYNNQITSVTIPNNVTTIGQSAFNGNQISTLSFGENSQLTSIGSSAFSSNQITSVTIPNSVTTIGSSAFNGNQITGEMIIPSSVTTIGDQAFSVNQITNLTIPNSVTAIGGNAFSANQIEKLLFEEGSQLTTIGGYSFHGNQITSVTIPNSVTTIGNSAFENNSITNLTIPNSVTTIGFVAFGGNNNLLTNLNIDMTTIPRDVFTSHSIQNLVLGSNVKTIGDNAFSFNQLTSITIPSSVTTIGSSAFSSNQLTSVTIPNSVTTIGDYAFLYNPNLTTITIKRANSDGMTLGNHWNENARIVYDPS